MGFFYIRKGEGMEKTIARYRITIEEAVNELQEGRMVLICDDDTRENEADLCMAAQFATAEKVNFIIRSACGLL
ncbi:MAG: hypothetical protein E6J34_20085, partial [Chloroflexi bacterium]